MSFKPRGTKSIKFQMHHQAVVKGESVDAYPVDIQCDNSLAIFVMFDIGLYIVNHNNIKELILLGLNINRFHKSRD
jgi:hypothetical protein